VSPDDADLHDGAGPPDEGAGKVPFTVRRAAAKLGRNDPCHCGSGKKYKRCCLDKDRERLADPSPYAGLTMDEAKRDPTRHGDPEIFLEMTRAELDAVDRGPLDADLLRGLIAAYRERGELEAASQAVAVLAERAGGEAEGAVGAERDALVYEALRRGDARWARLEAARRQGGETFESQLNRLTLDLAHRPPEKLTRLEGYLAQLIDAPRDLTELADAVALAGLPGLTLAISRAAVVLGGSQGDREVLADLLADERARLGLDERDPAFRLLGAGIRPARSRRSDEALADLQGRLADRESAIAEVRAERDRLAAELARQSAAAPQAGATTAEAAASDEDARRLRRKVEELQAELREKQREREALSKQLRGGVPGAAGEAGRGRGRGEAPAPAVEEEVGEDVPDDAAIEPLRFAPIFYESAADLDDRRLALRAQELAVRFAALDPATWKQAKKMQDLSGVFTLRVGIHHRLFLVRGGGATEARELCTREAFDRVLKVRYRR